MTAQLPKIQFKAKGSVTEPEEFSKDYLLYRRNILISFSLSFLLFMSVSLKPVIMGISISPKVMWLCLGIGHIYQFIMWRLTSSIEQDSDKRFFNFRGIFRQAIGAGTKRFPSKTKAQMWFLRALPIWAFIFGILFISIGFIQTIK
ncbi:hypothetical protein [Colwellia psychrerythraea]|uniref:Uncharacterized protein n=1 Tax=Colwellia psychrerythraea (strain 34H / ATCC BAA-681) TaxID=167879 RepID=Q48AF1_COLP3|nr:hypothetical protein [Colwellia psychrerythraea]AAZ26351.1 hypothetical protein CPS_0194 [Colwellia psychrerythraea 34H]